MTRLYVSTYAVVAFSASLMALEMQCKKYWSLLSLGKVDALHGFHHADKQGRTWLYRGLSLLSSHFTHEFGDGEKMASPLQIYTFSSNLQPKNINWLQNMFTVCFSQEQSKYQSNQSMPLTACPKHRTNSVRFRYSSLAHCCWK